MENPVLVVFLRSCPTELHALPIVPRFIQFARIHVLNSYCATNLEKKGGGGFALHSFIYLMNVPGAHERVVRSSPEKRIFAIISVFIIGSAGENNDVAMTFGVLKCVCNVA